MGLNVNICPFTSSARGVAILFNRGFEYKINRVKTDPCGNYIIVDILIANQIQIRLVNLYGPNEDKPEFYTNIFNIIEDFGNVNYIKCGDWNLILDAEKDQFIKQFIILEHGTRSYRI